MKNSNNTNDKSEDLNIKKGQEDGILHKGSEELIDKYNINDQAHSDSSKDEFIDTVSNFHHSDESKKEDKE